MSDEKGIVKVSIDETVIEQIIRAGDEVTFYPKLTEAGFLLGDNVYKEFQGQIIQVSVHGGKFEEGEYKSVPLPEDGQLPEGYTPRAELTAIVNGQRLCIRVPGWTYRNRLSKYCELLKRNRHKLGEVFTKIEVTHEKYKEKTFAALRFQAVGKVDQSGSSPIDIAPTPRDPVSRISNGQLSQPISSPDHPWK